MYKNKMLTTLLIHLKENVNSAETTLQVGRIKIGGKGKFSIKCCINGLMLRNLIVKNFYPNDEAKKKQRANYLTAPHYNLNIFEL